MPSQKLSYLALGDSIATGTQTPFQRTLPYPVILRNMLQTDTNTPVVLYNMAKNGLDSAGLLRLLHSDRSLQKTAARSDLITVSIGGNDVLKGVSVPGFLQFDARRIESGLSQFSKCFPAVIDLLKELSPHCVLFTMTLYNPYRRRSCPPCDQGLFYKSEQYLSRLNSIVLTASKGKATVVGIHRQFSARQESSVGSLTMMYPPGILRNPHPSAAGQRHIAQAHFDLLKKQFAAV